MVQPVQLVVMARQARLGLPALPELLLALPGPGLLASDRRYWPHRVQPDHAPCYCPTGAAVTITVGTVHHHRRAGHHRAEITTGHQRENAA